MEKAGAQHPPNRPDSRSACGKLRQPPALSGPTVPICATRAPRPSTPASAVCARCRLPRASTGSSTSFGKACGFMTSTPICPSSGSHTTTLQDISAPIRGSAQRAWLARLGLQAPGIREGWQSTSSLTLRDGLDIGIAQEAEPLLLHGRRHTRDYRVKGCGETCREAVHGCVLLKLARSTRANRGTW